jgi:hypothetical protein
MASVIAEAACTERLREVGRSLGYVPPMTRRRLIGRWRIVEMDLWDRDALDLVEPAYIEFDDRARGCFGFIAVEGDLDCRHADVDGRARVDFTWEGDDEGDARSGRGWAQLEPDGALRGHIFFHAGNDSGFLAGREAEEPST